MKPLIRTFVIALALIAVACNKEEPDKAGGRTGSAAANSGQKSGSEATSNRSASNSQGSDADGVACDASVDGVGWCVSDEEILFCSEGEWWLLDCTAIEEAAFCGYDEEVDEVDCYVGE